MLAILQILGEAELVAADRVRRRAGAAQAVQRKAEERREGAAGQEVEIRIEHVARAVVRVLPVRERGKRAEGVAVAVAEPEAEAVRLVRLDAQRARRTGAEVGGIDAQAVEEGKRIG